MEFQAVYNTFQPTIRRYLTRWVGADEAEDLTQEVFEKISRGLKSFRGESQLSTWIYRIATHAALDRLRRPSFRRRVQQGFSEDSISRDEPPTRDKEGSMGNTAPPVDQQLIRTEMNECIRNFIENLPENYKTVLILSELEDLKNSEVAKILGISLETVKVRLHRARANLKKELETHCSFYRDERGELACDLKAVFRELRETG
ncbi:MAG: RNA polymerase sigma factor [Nitrospirae bacterium]|nr:RNA polymerase sigma factor [Nitrospirota bacterium]